MSCDAPHAEVGVIGRDIARLLQESTTPCERMVALHLFDAYHDVVEFVDQALGVVSSSSGASMHGADAGGLTGWSGLSHSSLSRAGAALSWLLLQSTGVVAGAHHRQSCVAGPCNMFTGMCDVWSSCPWPTKALGVNKKAMVKIITAMVLRSNMFWKESMCIQKILSRFSWFWCDTTDHEKTPYTQNYTYSLPKGNPFEYENYVKRRKKFTQQALWAKALFGFVWLCKAR